jgi:hypothetical protein
MTTTTVLPVSNVELVKLLLLSVVGDIAVSATKRGLITKDLAYKLSSELWESLDDDEQDEISAWAFMTFGFKDHSTLH